MLSRRAKLGASCRVRVPAGKKPEMAFVRVSHPPVSSLGSMAELSYLGNEQDGLSVGRESCRPKGRSRSLKCWYSFEITVADAEGFNVRRRQHRSIRFGEDVEVRRSHQAVARMKRCTRNLGDPSVSRTS